MKRLENIDDKNEQLLKTINNKTESIKQVTDFIKVPLSLEAKTLIEEIKTIEKDINYKKSIIRGGNNTTYDFSYYRTINELFKVLYYRKMTINDAKSIQNKFDQDLFVLNNYGPKAQNYIEAKNRLLDNVKNFYKGRKKIIEGFQNRIFPYTDGIQIEKDTNEESMLKNELIDTTDMPELESEESAEQRKNQQGEMSNAK